MALEALMQIRSGEHRRGIVRLRQAFPGLGGPAQATIPTEILHAYYPLEFESVIRDEAREAGLPAHLVAGIIRQESAFDPGATSPVGARGLMQVMPATAREVAGKLDMPYAPARLYDPAYSVRLGATYFAQLLDMFDGNVELSLASYNGGPNRIRRLWREQGADARLDDFFETLNIDESRNYVKRILVLADSYRQLYPEKSRLAG
jgi:soluble lytic murein transglycosylase